MNITRALELLAGIRQRTFSFDEVEAMNMAIEALRQERDNARGEED